MSRKGGSPIEEAVDNIIVSVKSFNENRSDLVRKVHKNDKSYVNPVINHICSVIFSSKKNGLQKFLGLHLLKDCLDQKTPAVVDYTEKTLLSKLTKLAEELGKAKNTKERAKVLDVTEYPEASGNFTALLLECILEWSKMFGETNKAFKKSYDNLVKKKIPFPEEKKYFKSNVQKDSRTTDVQQQQQQPQPKTNPRASDDKPPISTTNKSLGTRSQTPSTNVQQDGKPPGNHPLVIKTEKLISEIVELKKSIQENFSASNEVDRDVIVYFMDHVQKSSADLQKAVMELSAAQVPNSDPLIDKAFHETGTAEDLVNAFQRYLKETRDFSLLKMEIQGLLAADPKAAGNNKYQAKSTKDEPKKTIADKKPSGMDQPKRSESTSRAKNESGGDPSPAADDNKPKDPKSANTSFEKGTEGKKTQTGTKSVSSKDPFSAFNAAKKDEKSANKDIFASFTSGAPTGKTKKSDYNFGAESWDNQPEEKKEEDTPHQSKPGSGNDFEKHDYGWGDEKSAQRDENDQGDQKKGFGLDDFGETFTEDEGKGKAKKISGNVKDTFEADQKPKKNAEGGRVKLKPKDEKEEGIVIIDDPNSFAGFNFGDSAPPKQTTEPKVRQRDIQQHEEEEKSAVHGDVSDQEPVIQKSRPQRNDGQDFHSRDDLGGAEPKKDHEDQSGFYFDGETADNRKQKDPKKEQDVRGAEAEEEEKGGEIKGFGFGNFEDHGAKKDGDGGFGFGNQGDDFTKGFFDGSDNFFDFGDKTEKKDDDKRGEFFSANANFFSDLDQPNEESQPQKKKSQTQDFRDENEASEQTDLQKIPKAKKGFSFQDSVQAKSSDSHPAEFSPAFKGSWDTKKPEYDFANFEGIKPQKVQNENEDDVWKDAATGNNLGAFDFSNDAKKNQNDKQSNRIEIPKGLGKAEDAIQVLLTSHLQKSAQLESERAKEERDKIFGDLDAVRKMYSEMKSQFERIRTEQVQMTGSYSKVKEELSVLSQVNKDYGSEFKKLKNVAEEQKKAKSSLRQDAQQQLLKSQTLNSEISQLKQQLAKTDSKESKEHIKTKINELEKQLQSNTNFLQTVGALLQASEQEDQENLKQITKLGEIAHEKATPPKQRSPSPEDKTRRGSPDKSIDEIVRLKEYQNPTLVSAVSLLRASRQMREQDLKAFASGQMPKVSDTPVNLKISTSARIVQEQKNMLSSYIASPKRPEPSLSQATSVVRDRFLNLDSINGGNDWRATSNLVSPSALSGNEFILPKYTNNYVQSSTENLPPSYQFNLNLQNPAPQIQVQPTIDNPVLRQVSELLEKSKKLRVDNSKFSLKKENELTSQAPLGSIYGDKITSLTQTKVLSPTLSILDPNRGLPYNQDHVSTNYTPSTYGFRKELPSEIDFGVKSSLISPSIDSAKQYNPDFLRDYSLKQPSGFTRVSDLNEEPENSLASALEKINLKSSTINLKSSRFLKDKQAPKVKGQKAGRFVPYSSYVFDRIISSVESNRHLRDADLFRYACLASKSALLDSPILQIGVVSNLDRGIGSYSEPRVSIILHYGNKTATEMSNFNVNTAGVRGISVSNDVYGFQIASRFQLKQEFTQSFRDFEFSPVSIEITFGHNSSTSTFSVPLPFSLTKFMEFKYINTTSFKDRWRALKSDCVKINHRKPNPKLFNDISDLNRFFSGLIIDLRSPNPRTQKMKYGGFFTLPDNYEYFVKINKGSKGCKISVSTDNPSKIHAEHCVQQFTFLFTI